MSVPPPHEVTRPSGIVLPDPDQGTPYILGQCAMPSTTLMVWEPFGDGEAGGHNLFGFTRRWAEWEASDAPFLQAIDPRFGFPMQIPRAALAHVIAFTIAYHRKEDVRAGARGGGLAVPGQPTVRQLGNGAFEIGIPTR